MYYLIGTALTCQRHKHSYRPGQGEACGCANQRTAPAQSLQLKQLDPQTNITCIWLGHGPGTQLTYMIETIGFLRPSTYPVNPISALELS